MQLSELVAWFFQSIIQDLLLQNSSQPAEICLAALVLRSVGNATLQCRHSSGRSAFCCFATSLQPQEDTCGNTSKLTCVSARNFQDKAV